MKYVISTTCCGDINLGECWEGATLQEAWVFLKDIRIDCDGSTLVDMYALDDDGIRHEVEWPDEWGLPDRRDSEGNALDDGQWPIVVEVVLEAASREEAILRVERYFNNQPSLVSGPDEYWQFIDDEE